MTTYAAAILADHQADAPRTLTLLQAVPEDKFDWKPHSKSMTLAALAGHLAECPAWIGAMVEGDMDMSDMQDYQPFVPATKAELLETFETNMGVARQALEGTDQANMESMWKMRAGDKVLMEQPRKDVVRDFGLHHTAHHRGQLTVYLRMLDIPVPSTFGPTADDPGPMGDLTGNPHE